MKAKHKVLARWWLISCSDKPANETFSMLSQPDFFSPEPHVIISDLIYAYLKYPGEINNPKPFQDPPLPGKPCCCQC